jgi:hypothetical protein
MDLDINTFLARKRTAEPIFNLRSPTKKTVKLVTEPLEKNLLNQAARSSWLKSDSPKHIASHLQSIKFGREDYGYGLGNIEVKSIDPLSATSSSFARVSKNTQQNPL